MSWMRLERQHALAAIEAILKDAPLVEFRVDGDVVMLRRPLAVEVELGTDVQAQGIAGIILDDSNGDVWVEGQRTSTLTRMEYDLLTYLYRRKDAIVSREELCLALWPKTPDQESFGTLEKLVSRLREKIEPNSDNPRFLLTVRGRGYRLKT